jgi:hypothetical protein
MVGRGDANDLGWRTVVINNILFGSDYFEVDERRWGYEDWQLGSIV